MARYSVVAPYTKRGTMTFVYGAGYPSTTFAEFTDWLDQNSFSQDCEVILQIPNGTVLTEPLVINGSYPFLTLHSVGTCTINSDALPGYQPFPAAPLVLVYLFIYSPFYNDINKRDAAAIGKIKGTFQKTGLKPVTFAYLYDIASPMCVGESFGNFNGIPAPVPLTLIDFDAIGLFQSLGLTGHIISTLANNKFTNADLNLGAYLQLAGSTDSSAHGAFLFEPYGTVDVVNQSGFPFGLITVQPAISTLNVSLRTTTLAAPNISCGTFFHVIGGKPAELSYFQSGGGSWNAAQINIYGETNSLYEVSASGNLMVGSSNLPSDVHFKTNTANGFALLGKVGDNCTLNLPESQPQYAVIDYDATGTSGSLFRLRKNSYLTMPSTISLTAGTGTNPQEIKLFHTDFSISYAPTADFASNLTTYHSIASAGTISVSGLYGQYINIVESNPTPITVPTSWLSAISFDFGDYLTHPVLSLMGPGGFQISEDVPLTSKALISTANSMPKSFTIYNGSPNSVQGIYGSNDFSLPSTAQMTVVNGALETSTPRRVHSAILPVTLTQVNVGYDCRLIVLEDAGGAVTSFDIGLMNDALATYFPYETVLHNAGSGTVDGLLRTTLPIGAWAYSIAAGASIMVHAVQSPITGAVQVIQIPL